MNLSMQSIPFGSSLLCTKQLNASRNCSPQGPCAMPPKQGQSQLISPVSSLNAPCCPASSSRAPGSEGEFSTTAVLDDCSGVYNEGGSDDLGFIDGGDDADGFAGTVGTSSGCGGRKRAAGDNDSRVGKAASPASASWMASG